MNYSILSVAKSIGMLSPFEQSKLGHAINRFTAFLENPIFYAMMSVFIRLLEIEKCS